MHPLLVQALLGRRLVRSGITAPTGGQDPWYPMPRPEPGPVVPPIVDPGLGGLRPPGGPRKFRRSPLSL